MQAKVRHALMNESRLRSVNQSEDLSSFLHLALGGRAITVSAWRKTWSDLCSQLDRLLHIRTQDRYRLHLHNEDTFHYLLSNETKRSERSGRSFQVLLAYVTAHNGSIERMGNNVSGKLLLALSHSLRETDYIGWYHD